ncbi:MAG: SDH family Clp fold serine proteinase [Thermoprotei archaeon]
MDDWSFIINNLWILLIVIFILTPWLQRRALKNARESLLRKLSQTRNSAVITLIHRQETVSFLGIPVHRYIDIDDSEDVLRAIRMTLPGTPIDIIVHTPGGIALAAVQIAFALKSHQGKKTVIVPHYAMSGGTLIALAADEIIMDPHAVLGPVDPQIGDESGVYPAATIIKIVQQKGVQSVEDKTLILAEESRKALEQMEKVVRKIIGNKYSEEKVKEIIDELVSGKYTHDHPFTADDIQRLLGTDKVKTEVPKEVYQLMSLYEMETRTRRPNVEYIPVLPKPAQ